MHTALLQFAKSRGMLNSTYALTYTTVACIHTLLESGERTPVQWQWQWVPGQMDDWWEGRDPGTHGVHCSHRMSVRMGERN